MSGIERKSVVFSVVIHVAVVLVVLMSSLMSGCLDTKKETVIPMEFIIVTEENAADHLAEVPNEETEEPEPEPLSEPPAPEPPPPLEVPDPIPPPPPLEEKKPEPKKVEKKKEVKQPEKKVEKKKPTKPKIKIGKRVGPVTEGKKDKSKAATEKKTLSDAEIKKMLGMGAKSGNKNQIPTSEASRCFGQIRAAFKEKCDAYGLEASPTGRDPELKVVFGSGGRVTSVSISRSSGDRAFDQQVLQACRQVRQVSGLSSTFLSEYKTVEIVLQ